jgi:lysozyme
MPTQMPNWKKFVGGSALATSIALGGYFEGERLVAYYDVGGTPTICDGETQGVFMGMTATHAECQAWLAKGMQARLDFVNAHLLKKQPDNVQAALADFAYNEGNDALLSSQAFQDINKGNLEKGCNELTNWEVVHGKVQPGLVTRRTIEKYLCLSGVSK